MAQLGSGGGLWRHIDTMKSGRLAINPKTRKNGKPPWKIFVVPKGIPNNDWIFGSKSKGSQLPAVQFRYMAVSCFSISVSETVTLYESQLFMSYNWICIRIQFFNEVESGFGFFSSFSVRVWFAITLKKCKNVIIFQLQLTRMKYYSTPSYGFLRVRLDPDQVFSQVGSGLESGFFSELWVRIWILIFTYLFICQSRFCRF